MPLQFQPYPGAKTKRELQDQNLQGVEQGIQGIGNSILAYKQHKLALANHDLQLQQVNAQMDALKQETASKYGTGAPAPQLNTPYTPPTFDPSGGTGDLSQMGNPSPGAGVGPGIPGTPLPETPSQNLSRIGTEAYKALNPPQYVATGVGPDGQPTFAPLPAGTKPGPVVPQPTTVLSSTGQNMGTVPGKPSILPAPAQPKGAPTPIQNRFDTDFTKAYNFLSKIKGNLDTLQTDAASPQRKLTLGKFSPTAGQGFIGATVRALGVGTPEQAAFASNVGKANDIYRKEITGSQAGFSELAKLENRLPTTAETEPNFIAKSNDTLQQGVQTLEKELERAKAKGIDTSVYEQQLGELKSGIQRPQSPVLHSAALDWANANPTDPRAAAVRKKALQDLGANQ